MRVTKATIKKAIKELGFNIENFEINGNTIMTALEDMEEGNEQVNKIVEYLSNKGTEYHGFETGFGAWRYTFEAQSYSQKLATLNID